ncbi:metal-dependent hydrolase [Pseudalkalibacillus berkeleyi]|uniref:Metal-dependent hydrolase n=1 Tax=Pseudalkalibacillus berkeleyi TaxID=1069813 RepID=A0ABS9GYH4_9BACL|nr:metal-dependent hydrolase [Pseudalkalibacillus berkeleyi]MCF6136653.1 metal-dependent hydrolase [Pseudalkalibacillus berkeleyi]
MKGTSHLLVGGVAGLVTSNVLQTDPLTTGILIISGGIAGLVPDIDVDGTLSNKITNSHKFLQTLAYIIGVIIMAYSFMTGSDSEKWNGIGAGVGIILIASFITRRHMLLVSGLGVVAAGLFLDENWLFLSGIYITVASIVPHRSYTHSILGVIFFGVIASQLETSVGVNGLYWACLAGYVSHLVGDMKFLPVNKRGIKLFLPFSTKDF